MTETETEAEILTPAELGARVDDAVDNLAGALADLEAETNDPDLPHIRLAVFRRLVAAKVIPDPRQSGNAARYEHLGRGPESVAVVVA